MKTVGIIGTGVIATQVHIPILLAMDDVRVEWIADANAGLAESVAKAHGVKAASLEHGVERLPAVDVALLAIPLPPRQPYFDHFRRSETVLLVEKPLANDALQHRALAAGFPEWRIAVGYQRRFYASFATIRDFVESGTLGRLLGIRVEEGGRTTRTEGAGQYQSLPVRAGGGIVKNLGCHALDLALWISDASGFELRERRVEWDGETDQSCRASIGLRSNVGNPIDLDFATSWIDRMENRFDFRFEGGILSCPVTPTSEIELRSPAGRTVARISLGGPGRATTPRQAYYLEWRTLLDAGSRRSPQRVSARVTQLGADLMDSLLAREVPRP